MSAMLPPALRPGGTVGVIAPATPPRGTLLQDTVSYWEGRGHPVVVGKNVGRSLGGYLGGTAAERASDLNAMIADPKVELIVSAMGGKGSVHLLPLIDYDTFASQPKLFMGLSDVSLLVLAMHVRTGVVTFHGPTGMDFGSLPAYSEKAMHSALTAVEPLGDLPAHGEWQTLRDGDDISGRLIGGHLGTIRSLIGTPYEPEWEGAVLFVEEIDAELHDVDVSLSHFALAGIFDKIAALVVGRPVAVEERWRESDEQMSDVVLRNAANFDFPVLYDVDLGHAPEKVTLPVGAMARVEPGRSGLAVEEPSVRPATGHVS
jgi:muramoyltetrapeptide carboxypeptidase